MVLHRHHSRPSLPNVAEISLGYIPMTIDAFSFADVTKKCPGKHPGDGERGLVTLKAELLCAMMYVVGLY